MSNYSEEAIKALNTFGVSKAINLDKEKDRLWKWAQNFLAVAYSEDYLKFVDAFEGDIDKATREDFHKFLMETVKGESVETVQAKAIAANAIDERTCVVPAEPIEDTPLKYARNAKDALDSIESDVLIDIVQKGRGHGEFGFVIAQDEAIKVDIELLMKTKGAMDSRAIINRAIGSMAKGMEANGFVFMAFGKFTDRFGDHQEFLLIYSEWSDGSRDIRVKKVIRNNEGKIKTFKDRTDIDPEAVEGYFVGIIPERSFT